MVRVRELWPEYQNSKYQAAIDMLDSVSFGVLTILASEASDSKFGCKAINDEANVQDFLRMFLKQLF